MGHAARDERDATLLKAMALVVFVFGLLCVFHGVDHMTGSLCAATILLSAVVALDPGPHPSRPFRLAPAFSWYVAIPRLPDPPPKLRPV